MAQHFLLSAKARTLSLRSIFAGGEEKAYATFRKLRWPETDGEPVCPHCGCSGHYEITTRRKRFKCAACQQPVQRHQRHHLRHPQDVVHRPVGRDLHHHERGQGHFGLAAFPRSGLPAKTAFVLAHKIREALASETSGRQPVGDVEIDGAYFGGHVRPANRKEDRIDRRLSEHQTGRAPRRHRASPARRPHLDVRPQDGSRRRADRSERVGRLTRVLCRRRLALGSPARRVRHATGSITARPIRSDGISTNQVESYFSRLRRMVDGQHHHVSPRTSTPTPPMRLGWKIIAASTTARPLTGRLGWRWRIRFRPLGV